MLLVLGLGLGIVSHTKIKDFPFRTDEENAGDGHGKAINSKVINKYQTQEQATNFLKARHKS